MAPSLGKLPTELLDHITDSLPQENLASKTCFSLCCKTILSKVGSKYLKRISMIESRRTPDLTSWIEDPHPDLGSFGSFFSRGWKTRPSSEESEREESYRLIDHDQLDLIYCPQCKTCLGVRGQPPLPNHPCTCPSYTSGRCCTPGHRCAETDSLATFVRARRLMKFCSMGWDCTELLGVFTEH